MKKRVWIVGAVMAATLGGGALAQTGRVPSGSLQTPNLAVAPASATDVAALQARLAQLEAAHNTTRTELAQTRLRLNALKAAVQVFAQCEYELQLYHANPVVAGTNTVPHCTLTGAGQTLDATNKQRLANALAGIQD